MWIPNIRALSGPFRTYAVDNIYDYGRSVYTRAVKDPDDLVRWLDELVDGLELGNPFNLMGLSYGGWISCLYALRFSNRLAKIVLLAPACTILPVSLSFMLRAVFVSLSPGLFAESFMKWLFTDLMCKDRRSRAILEDGVSDMRVASRCFKPKRLVRPTLLKDGELAGIKVPTLILVGENEKIYSARSAVLRLDKVAPQIHTEIIPCAGHGLSIEQPDLVNEKALQFLSRP
jgi:pimeloyl-ACP methyl ester carboxylesterase